MYQSATNKDEGEGEANKLEVVPAPEQLEPRSHYRALSAESTDSTAAKVLTDPSSSGTGPGTPEPGQGQKEENVVPGPIVLQLPWDPAAGPSETELAAAKARRLEARRQAGIRLQEQGRLKRLQKLKVRVPMGEPATNAPLYAGERGALWSCIEGSVESSVEQAVYLI